MSEEEQQVQFTPAESSAPLHVLERELSAGQTLIALGIIAVATAVIMYVFVAGEKPFPRLDPRDERSFWSVLTPAPKYDLVDLWPKNYYLILEACEHKGTNLVGNDVFHCVLRNGSSEVLRLADLRVDYYDATGIKLDWDIFLQTAAPGERVRLQMTPPPETRAIKAAYRGIDLARLRGIDLVRLQ